MSFIVRCCYIYIFKMNDYFFNIRLAGQGKLFFLFCTFNTVKRISKRSSFRYRLQEHLLKFLMLAVTPSDHYTSRHFKFQTCNCSSSYQCYQPFISAKLIFLALCFELFFFNLKFKIGAKLKKYCITLVLQAILSHLFAS
jgi:hypothetical protein